METLRALAKILGGVITLTSVVALSLTGMGDVGEWFLAGAIGLIFIGYGMFSRRHTMPTKESEWDDELPDHEY